MALSLSTVVALTGCAQGGSRDAAVQAADDFLTALVRRDAHQAWSHLTPRTREVTYANDEARFAEDVNSADWSRMSWTFGSVSDLDISWGVHVVVVNAAAIPAFLGERGLAAVQPASGLDLLVQTPNWRPYMIAALGYDERL